MMDTKKDGQLSSKRIQYSLTEEEVDELRYNMLEVIDMLKEEEDRIDLTELCIELIGNSIVILDDLNNNNPNGNT